MDVKGRAKAIDLFAIEVDKVPTRESHDAALGKSPVESQSIRRAHENGGVAVKLALGKRHALERMRHPDGGRRLKKTVRHRATPKTDAKDQDENQCQNPGLARPPYGNDATPTAIEFQDACGSEDDEKRDGNNPIPHLASLAKAKQEEAIIADCHQETPHAQRPYSPGEIAELTPQQANGRDAEYEPWRES